MAGARVDPRELIFVAFLIGGGIKIFFSGFSLLRQRRLIENIPTSTVRGMAMGLVEVCGKARASALLKSPLTMTDCVYYRYSVEEYKQQGKHARWVKIDSGNSGTHPFSLDDGTGSVLVHPEFAQFEMEVDYKFENGWRNPLPERLTEFMDSRNLSYKAFLGQRRLRFNEWYIMPGQEVYVLGTAGKFSEVFNQARGVFSDADKGLPEEAQQQLKGQRNDVNDVVIAKGSDEKTFIISDRRQEDVLARFASFSFYYVFGGVIVALGGLGWLVYFLQRLMGR
jgi:hypothetical protein